MRWQRPAVPEGLVGFSVFYSWQSDAPGDCNRAFIRKALDAAVAALGATVENSPRVESGMEGIAGTPEVATVMFTRIKRSAVFLGDMTLVGSITKGDSAEVKRVPNPNVLLEMGYAAGTIGWGRVVCVMNEHFGKRTDLPFDVRNRRFPIDYALAPGDKSSADRVRADLARWIKFAIESVLKNEYEVATDALSALDVNCLNLMGARGKEDYFSAPNPNQTTFGGPLDTGRFNAAVIRLLDLRMLKAEVDPIRGLYAYNWTYLGKQDLQRLAIRNAAPAEPGGGPNIGSESVQAEGLPPGGPCW
jgi:hypothetical protein